MFAVHPGLLHGGKRWIVVRYGVRHVTQKAEEYCSGTVPGRCMPDRLPPRFTRELAMVCRRSWNRKLVMPARCHTASRAIQIW